LRSRHRSERAIPNLLYRERNVKYFGHNPKGVHVLKNFTGLVALIVCILALAAGPAMAQPTATQDAYPTADAYGGQVGAQQTGGGSGGGGPTVSSGSTGSLPFTGFQLGMAALVGAGMIGTGFVLRRTVRAPSGA
jgi:hypothetical protein